MQSIHISTLRKMLQAGDPVDLKVWNQRTGGIIEYNNVIPLKFDFYGGTRNIKIKASGQIRKVRDCCIFMCNGLEVIL